MLPYGTLYVVTAKLVFLIDPVLCQLGKKNSAQIWGAVLFLSRKVKSDLFRSITRHW